MNNAPIRSKQCTHAVDMHKHYYLMIYNTDIPSVATIIWSKLIFVQIFFNKSTSTYYDDNNEEKNEDFGLLFRQHTKKSVKNIYHPA